MLEWFDILNEDVRSKIQESIDKEIKEKTDIKNIDTDELDKFKQDIINLINVKIGNLKTYYNKKFIQGVIREEVNNIYIKEIKKEIYDFIEGTGKEIIFAELKKINPSNVIIKRFDDLLAEKFKPLFDEVYKHIDRKLREKITNHLRKSIMLKTSTLTQEITHLNNVDVDEKGYLNDVENILKLEKEEILRLEKEKKERLTF